MIPLLSVIFTVSSLWAGPKPKPLYNFEHYCAQLSTPAPSVILQPNSRVQDLMAIVDATNKLDKLMHKYVLAGYSYQGFKSKMAEQNFPLNDQFHAAAYARAAAFKCAFLSSEATAGDTSNSSHNSEPVQLLLHRIDDSTTQQGPLYFEPDSTAPGADTEN